MSNNFGWREDGMNGDGGFEGEGENHRVKFNIKNGERRKRHSPEN